MWDLYENFLYWLHNIGNPNILPKAQPALERYANSERFYGDTYAGFVPTQGVRLRYEGEVGPFMFGSDVMPAEIYRYSPEPGDTVYVEKPTRADSKYGLIKRSERRASTKNRRGKEYDVLKRRFETAWNLAK